MKVNKIDDDFLETFHPCKSNRHKTIPLRLMISVDFFLLFREIFNSTNVAIKLSMCLYNHDRESEKKQ